MSAPATGTPPPPPEAELIRLAREAKGISPETAAAHADIRLGGSRWRQIEAGWRKDARKPVIAKANTLAHMARAVGVTADRLAEAGREDAAVILREIQRTAKPQNSEGDTPDWLPAWLREDPRALAIWNLKLPVERRIQGIRDLMEADLRRAREQEEQLGRETG